MESFVLSRAGRRLFPFLLILSIWVLYRGHNLPGGGFIGGLLAAMAFILVGLGDSMDYARKKLRIRPTILMGIGLAVAVGSGFFAMIPGEPYMTGEWLPTFSLPGLGKIHLGTPTLFDVGVFLTVAGFVLHVTFSLAEMDPKQEEDD